MGMTTITPTLITSAGIVQATYLAECTECGDRYKPNANNEFIRVKNASGSSITFTIPAQHGGSDIGPISVAATTGDKTIAISLPWEYIDVDGYININYVGTLTADTTVGVFRLPTPQ